MAFTKIKSFRFFLVCITLHNIQDILAKTPWQKSCRTFGSIFLNTPNQYASSHLHILLRGGETVRNTTISNTTQNLIFHATKPGDGSSTDPDGIPNRFLIMQKQNRMKAKKKHLKQHFLGGVNTKLIPSCQDLILNTTNANPLYLISSLGGMFNKILSLYNNWAKYGLI